ncbi:MAG TPA: D-isomer specific 2-hydroxyacid dehydrogenase family protein [Streptosporangiaceae bacterium]|nr:D-isomer specific 2-hydroxyacid dehydrogenase family protein [Streptosporangiaceae bacterium]
MSVPRVAIGPWADESITKAVTEGGGEPAGLDRDADALIWLASSDPEGLREAVEATSPRWVQLSSAGIERMAEARVLDGERAWTCAKGCYAQPVAEHALMLALAGLRVLPERVMARSWGRPAGESLFGENVTILGAGGIATVLLELLRPFRVSVTVVRRGYDPVPGAARTLPMTELASALATARVVFVALALTPQTTGIIGAAELAAMRPDSWLVNVARGRHVQTDALVAALDAGTIAGAALDVTDPEPLPDGHPLWGHPRCIITPHTADTIEMIIPLLAARVRDNVRRFAAGRPLEGLVDPALGY